jgi:hypothetical protein
MDPDPTPFFSDFKDVKKNVLYIFSYNLPAGTLSSVLKFCVKILFCKHYFSSFITFMRNEKDPETDPDPYLSLTFGSRSGFGGAQKCADPQH